MRTLGVSRQTELQRVKRGDLEAIHVTRGKRKGLHRGGSAQGGTHRQRMTLPLTSTHQSPGAQRWGNRVAWRTRGAGAAGILQADADHTIRETAILKEVVNCVVDEARKVVREGKVASEPETIATWLAKTGLGFERIGPQGRVASPGDLGRTGGCPDFRWSASTLGT
jgi:hypothetical protein